MWAAHLTSASETRFLRPCDHHTTASWPSHFSAILAPRFFGGQQPNRQNRHPGANFAADRGGFCECPPVHGTMTLDLRRPGQEESEAASH
jgi:hypothetical protein